MSIGQCRETPPYFFRHQSTVNTHDPTREASPGFTMHRIVHMQCRGDWKVARVSIWRACAAVLCMRCVYFGRASTRPYSYAMRPGFCNALNCAYMQCRGDWKVARVSTGRICVAVLCMRCVYLGRASTRPYSYAVRHCRCFAMRCIVHTCSVGATGRSPAFLPGVYALPSPWRGKCMRCVYFGRASTRPYSYAMRHCRCFTMH